MVWEDIVLCWTAVFTSNGWVLMWFHDLETLIEHGYQNREESKRLDG